MAAFFLSQALFLLLLLLLCWRCPLNRVQATQSIVPVNDTSHGYIYQAETDFVIQPPLGGTVVINNFTELLQVKANLSFVLEAISDISSSTSDALNKSAVSLQTAFESEFLNLSASVQTSLMNLSTTISSTSAQIRSDENRTISLLTSELSATRSQLSALRTNVYNCLDQGMSLDENGTCIDRPLMSYSNGSLASDPAPSCLQIKLLYPSISSGFRYVVDQATSITEFVYCDLTIGIEIGKSPETAFSSCTSLLAFYNEQSLPSFVRPPSDTYTLFNADYSGTFQTFCNFDVDPCRPNVTIANGFVVCKNLSEGFCNTTCFPGFVKMEDAVVCSRGRLQGNAYCNKPMDRYEFKDFSGFQTVAPVYINTTYGGAGIQSPIRNSGTSRIATTKAYTSANGLTVEARVRQVDTTPECIVFQVFPQSATTRHSGYSWGQNWMLNGKATVGAGTDGNFFLSTYADHAGVGEWHVYRFTRSSIGLNKLYQDGILAATWSSTLYNSGVVSAGLSCVNFEIDYLVVLESELSGTDSLPLIDVSHTFGLPWMLSAKVTNDLVWACPDMRGARSCAQSQVSVSNANLFASSHARSKLELTYPTPSLESGVHIGVANINRLLKYGAGQIRFEFAVDDSWSPAAAGIASMGPFMQQYLFTTDSVLVFLQNQHYFFSVDMNRIVNATMTGEVICFSTLNGFRSGGEGGMQMGAIFPSNDPLQYCTIKNDSSAISLKSDLTLNGAWATTSNGYLGGAGHVPYTRLSIWVR